MGNMCRYDLRGQGKDVSPLLEFRQNFLRYFMNIVNIGNLGIICRLMQ
jgi:hypothetical protein